MKAIFLTLSLLLACAASAQGLGKEYDIRPGASNEAAPTAVEWSNRNDAALAKATAPDALKAFVASPEAADALLAKVRGAYGSDPIVLTQIAAVTQLVMTPDCKRAKAARELWSEALLRAASASTDGYRTVFFLDQLRWCADEDQDDAIEAIGEKSDDKAVRQMVELVLRELDDDTREEGGFFSFLKALWD